MSYILFYLKRNKKFEKEKKKFMAKIPLCWDSVKSQHFHIWSLQRIKFSYATSLNRKIFQFSSITRTKMKCSIDTIGPRRKFWAPLNVRVCPKEDFELRPLILLKSFNVHPLLRLFKKVGRKVAETSYQVPSVAQYLFD